MRALAGSSTVTDLSNLDDEQHLLYESVVAFAQRELNDELEQRDRDAVFSEDAWRKCAQFGLQGLPVPAEYGGGGVTATTIAAALEGLGYGCADNGLIFSLNAQLWACERPLVRFGSEEQKQRYLPSLCDGTLVAAHAASEPEAGSDLFSLRTTAIDRGGSRWILNGSKTFVTNAPESGLFIVLATNDPSLGFAGLCAFVVERDTAGLTVGAPLSKMGLRSSPMAELFFDDCEVDGTSQLGAVGAGMAIFNDAMLWERGMILAAAVGTMRRHLEQCVSYARERKQFAKPIGSFQAVSHRIADMRLRLETSRLMLYRLASRFDAGTATQLDAALTKLQLSESLVQSSLAAFEIHGGYGYMTEYGFERELRDALAGRIYSGTSDMQRNVVAHHLGL